MKKSKALLLALCAAALSVGATFGTLAYLTDSEAVANTFTVGQVGIELTETDVDENGVKDSETRVKENTYHLLPGRTYTKDPTIYVDDDSEDCYLFVKVENGIAGIETKKDGESVADQMESLNWVEIDDGKHIYVLAKGEGNAKYKYTVSKGAEVVVFENFTIDGSVTNTEIASYANKQIVVTAYAIQAAGFDNAQAAWAAFAAQHPNF